MNRHVEFDPDSMHALRDILEAAEAGGMVLLRICTVDRWRAIAVLEQPAHNSTPAACPSCGSTVHWEYPDGGCDDVWHGGSS